MSTPPHSSNTPGPTLPRPVPRPNHTSAPTHLLHTLIRLPPYTYTPIHTHTHTSYTLNSPLAHTRPSHPSRPPISPPPLYPHSSCRHCRRARAPTRPPLVEPPEATPCIAQRRRRPCLPAPPPRLHHRPRHPDERDARKPVPCHRLHRRHSQPTTRAADEVRPHLRRAPSTRLTPLLRRQCISRNTQEVVHVCRGLAAVSARVSQRIARRRQACSSNEKSFRCAAFSAAHSEAASVPPCSERARTSAGASCRRRRSDLTLFVTKPQICVTYACRLSAAVACAS